MQSVVTLNTIFLKIHLNTTLFTPNSSRQLSNVTVRDVIDGVFAVTEVWVGMSTLSCNYIPSMVVIALEGSEKQS